MQVTIDNHTIEVPPNSTVLEAIHGLGQDVPTLCYDPRQAAFGACRVCLVGAEGAPGPIPACTTPCRDGMRIDTQDPTARRVAAAIVELVLSELPEPPAPHTELAIVAERARRHRHRTATAEHSAGPASSTTIATTTATRISRFNTSSASLAGGACARATKCRAHLRSPPQGGVSALT